MEENQQVQVTEAPAEGKPQKPKKSVGREIFEWIVTILAALAIALVIRTFLFEPVKVDGHSMDTTLADGEIMLVTKTEYTTLNLFGNSYAIFGDPQRFDVVICHYPDRGNMTFVKRVVGLPGDTVEITGGYLYVNGEKYEEEYLTYRPNYEMAATVVPEGCYFVLGDNRSNSNDSHIIGAISREMIIGHVQRIVYPFSDWRKVE
jgi:signal peptidase I